MTLLTMVLKIIQQMNKLLKFFNKDKLLVRKGHLQSELNHVILFLHREYNKIIYKFIVFKLNN